jgi:hypothetical protein
MRGFSLIATAFLVGMDISADPAPPPGLWTG